MILAVTIIFAIVVPFGLWLLVKKAEREQALDKWIRPAAQVLIDNLPKGREGSEDGNYIRIADTLRTEPDRYIQLPKVWPIAATDLSSCVSVRFPVSPGSNEKLKDKLVSEIANRLGFDGLPSAEWVFSGHGALARLYPTPSFGEDRTVYDYLPHIAELSSAYKVVLGLDLEGKPVCYDHIRLGPHVKTSVGSGGGKSNLYRFLVPQYIRNGAQVIILDVKGVSMLDLAVALEFRNIKYFSEAETCHNAFQAVFAELERRRKEDIRARLEGRKVVFTPLHVVMEEANTLMAMLKDFWEYAKEAHAEAAKNSPAIRSMHYSVYMGREFGIYIHVIAQRAEAAVFGGGAVRENFNAALMSKWDLRTWKMLAHGHKYIPHPMDWSWYLVTSAGVVRYLPPSLQESDARLIADLDNVQELPWGAEIDAVPDVRVTSGTGYIPELTGENSHELVRGLPQIELAVTITLKQAHELCNMHGHVVPFTVMEQWQKGSRSATTKGYPEWPTPVGKNGRANVYKRTDIIKWFNAGPEPVGKFWDGVMVDIEREHCILKEHVIYGLKVNGYGGIVAYIGQTHQPLEVREEQHRDTQYWGDLIENSVIIFNGLMTCVEARELEGNLTDIVLPALNRPIPQVSIDGTQVVPKWNPAAINATALREARNARDVESGRTVFVSARDRKTV